MTREHVTVSLSGDAGDELFCGYTSYTSVDRIWGKMSKYPYAIRKTCSNILVNCPLVKNNQILQTKSYLLGAKSPEHLYELSNAQESSNLNIAMEKDVYKYKHNSNPYGELDNPQNSIMLMDMEVYHPDDILVKVDRTAMAVSLETRVPMLDKDVVEFAWTVPMDYKKQGEEGKLILKDVLYRYVPKEMMDRPKKGFSIPISKWLREPQLREWAESLIDKDMLARQNLLNVDEVWRIWNDFIENGNNIKACQWVQYEVGHLLVNVVPDVGFSETDKEFVRRETLKRTGADNMDIEIRVVNIDQLVYSSRGKFQLIVNKRS